MNLTDEQRSIINSTGNIKINAVAGSGKTTTIIEYAKAQPRNSRILYLAFNKSVKLDAINKFAKAGLRNVQVETAHSLAYKHIVLKNGYKIKTTGYKIHELVRVLSLNSNGEKYMEYILANHVNKFLAYFCNSDKRSLRDLNYLDIVSDANARIFVKTYYGYIERQTHVLLNKMINNEIEITHDFYLKKFQISNPTLGFDCILFDEGQDTSPAMLDIFLQQKAKKVIVGDMHQQIYGWRQAVNSLEKVEFPTYQLSKSFRFHPDIANLAMEILKWKSHLQEFRPVSISGAGAGTEIKQRAILARTNLGLLLKAIEYVIEKRSARNIYFEGSIHSYTYADEGTSLYDVLHLYNQKHKFIKDRLIREMRNLNDLEEYIKKTGDVQLSMMVEIVKKYGNRIPKIIKEIKEKHVENSEKEKAEVVFSTVHRCKGMEYDSVELVNDFINEEKLEKAKKGGENENCSKLNEEINLLYVAVTRTKNTIQIPESLLPKDSPSSPKIQPIKMEIEEETVNTNTVSTPTNPNGVTANPSPREKAYSMEEIRKTYKEAYKPWTEELDAHLQEMYFTGTKTSDLAKHFGRTRGAIRRRIEKLGLENL